MMTSIPRKPPFPSQASTLRALQIGMGWFAEQPGGLERFYDGLLRSITAAGVECTGLVAASADVAAQTNGAASSFSRADAMLPVRLLRARRAAGLLLASGDFDVVASHFPLYGFAAVAGNGGRRPLVAHFHGPWSAESAEEGAGAISVAAKRWVERAVYRRADRVIVLSRAFRDVVVQQFGVAADRVRVIPGGIDAGRYDVGLSRDEARTRLKWDVNRPTLLCVRRLVRRMGLTDLIAAIESVRLRVPDVLLLLAGRGPLERELREQIAGAGLQQHVRLLGFVPDDDLPLAYRAADLTVVPSVALEGFGLVAAESLAAGTPALVTPVGGLPEVVSALSPTLVLPQAGPAALAERITAILQGATAVPGDAACREYARRFDWSTVAAAVRDVYVEAVNARARSPIDTKSEAAMPVAAVANAPVRVQ